MNSSQDIDQNKRTPNDANVVDVERSELPLHCPLPDASLWNSHPRVFIPLEEPGDEKACIYCGTLYKLK